MERNAGTVRAELLTAGATDPHKIRDLAVEAYTFADRRRPYLNDAIDELEAAIGSMGTGDTVRRAAEACKVSALRALPPAVDAEIDECPGCGQSPHASAVSSHDPCPYHYGRENTDRHGATDGRLFPVRASDIAKGSILRMVYNSDGSAAAFSDFVVTEVYRDRAQIRTVKLARPYAFVSRIGHSVLTGTETLEVCEASILAPDSQFRSVVQSTGLVASHLT